MPEEVVENEPFFDELEDIISQRCRNLMDEDFTESQAYELAGLLYIDWHQAAMLRRGGCPYETILEILT